MRYSSFTSESVCSGHPVKICAQVSDAILDAALAQDKKARVAVETMVTKNFIALAGEVTVDGTMPYTDIARSTVKKLGYTDPKLGFTHRSPIVVKIHTQSREISAGVDTDGAGDQGMMFGYACDETPDYMPLPITLSHALARRIDEVRKKGILPYLRPDGKTQVEAEYENGAPKAIKSIVLAVPHREDVTLKQVRDDLFEHAVKHVLAPFGLTYKLKDLVVNGTGIWHIGGPASDTGVTGRKIVVDTYGGMARVGGGAFSGKDPTKVDRSGAYAARYLAKNIVAAKLAKRCEVRLAYFIGATKPVMQEAETFGTERASAKALRDYMAQRLDTSGAGSLKGLDLRRPIYQETAAYGHFGRNGFPWERIVS